MRTNPIQTPKLLKLAMTALLLAPILAGCAALIQEMENLKNALFLIAFGLFSFGLGEALNHSVQTGLSYRDQSHTRIQRYLHRKRNSCSFGNLLDIVALLLLFVGFSEIIKF